MAITQTKSKAGFFAYYGSKVRMLPYILPQINKIPHTVFCEPFAGSGCILFNKQTPLVTNNHHYQEYLNDTNDLVINFYRIAIKQPQELWLEIQATLHSQSDHARAKQICKNPEQYDELTLAWAFYVNIEMSFSRTLNRGFATGVFSRNHGATWHNKKQSLDWYLKRIVDVQFMNEDALRCIERIDSPQTLFYIDPPYPRTHQGHYSGYTLDDWQQLCDVLDDIDGSYVLSNYPQEIEPKSAQQRIEIDVTSSASGQGKVGKGRDKTRKASSEELGDRKRTEVIWVCDRSSRMRDELKPIAEANSRSLLNPVQQLSLFE